MEKDWLAVASEADIELDPTAIERLCLTEPDKGVFGRVRCGATMPDDRRNGDCGMRARCGKPCRRPSRRVSPSDCDTDGKIAAVPPGTKYDQVAAFTSTC